MKTGFTETGFIVNRSVAGFIENRFRLPVSGSICGHPVLPAAEMFLKVVEPLPGAASMIPSLAE